MPSKTLLPSRYYCRFVLHNPTSSFLAERGAAISNYSPSLQMSLNEVICAQDPNRQKNLDPDPTHRKNPDPYRTSFSIIFSMISLNIEAKCRWLYIFWIRIRASPKTDILQNPNASHKIRIRNFYSRDL